MMPQEIEGVLHERIRDWHQEVHRQQLLAQLPVEPARWRRWTGKGMVWIGTWLLRRGERVAQPECGERITVAG